MQNEKNMGMREAERYRDLVTKSLYSGEDCPYGLVYNPTFCVGERLYQARTVPVRPHCKIMYRARRTSRDGELR